MRCAEDFQFSCFRPPTRIHSVQIFGLLSHEDRRARPESNLARHLEGCVVVGRIANLLLVIGELNVGELVVLRDFAVARRLNDRRLLLDDGDSLCVGLRVRQGFVLLKILDGSAARRLDRLSLEKVYLG